MKGRPLVIVAVALAVFASALEADAQQPKKVYRIGFLQNPPREQTEHMLRALEEGLRERGYVVGRDIVSQGPRPDDSAIRPDPGGRGDPGGVLTV